MITIVYIKKLKTRRDLNMLFGKYEDCIGEKQITAEDLKKLNQKK